MTSIAVLKLLCSVVLSRALFVAADLSLPERLTHQPKTLTELATETGSHQAMLERLLHFLVLYDIIDQNQEGRYQLNAGMQELCGDHPQSIKPFLLHDDETRWNSFGHLGDAIKTGKPSFDELYGKDYFSYLGDHPLLSKRFDDAMLVISRQEDEAIAQKLSLHGVVADIGGGKGQLLARIKQAQSAVTKTILFDLAQVVEGCSTSDTAAIVAGSFFEPINVVADCYLLKRVLHDWDDEKAALILRNVAQAMSDTAQLYIIEDMLGVGSKEDQQLMAALDLAVFTLMGGKKRCLSEMQQLIEQAGLACVEVVMITPTMPVLVCKKK